MKKIIFLSFSLLASLSVLAQQKVQVQPAKGIVPDNGERFVPQENIGVGLPIPEYVSDEKTSTPPPQAGPSLNTEPSPTPEQQGFIKYIDPVTGASYYKKQSGNMIIYYTPNN